jgi:hypothetical protein
MKRLGLLLLICACGPADLATLREPGTRQTPAGTFSCVTRAAPAASASLAQQLLGAWRGMQGDELFVLEFRADGTVTHFDLRRDKSFVGGWSLQGSTLRLQFGDPESAAVTQAKVENGVLLLDYYVEARFEPVSC